ncbi:MAG: hypothetical protein WC859_06660 [Elusimicrobiota bacterium]|jgi:hypothetical protein
MRFLFLLGAISLMMAGPAPAASSHQQTSYAGKVQTELDHWGAKAQELQMRSQRAGARSREELDRHLQNLDGSLHTAKNKLEEMRSSTENKWKTIRPEVDHALADVRRAYRKTWTYFKKHQKEK